MIYWSQYLRWCCVTVLVCLLLLQVLLSLFNSYFTRTVLLRLKKHLVRRFFFFPITNMYGAVLAVMHATAVGAEHGSCVRLAKWASLADQVWLEVIYSWSIIHYLNVWTDYIRWFTGSAEHYIDFQLRSSSVRIALPGVPATLSLQCRGTATCTSILQVFTSKKTIVFLCTRIRMAIVCLLRGCLSSVQFQRTVRPAGYA